MARVSGSGSAGIVDPRSLRAASIYKNEKKNISKMTSQGLSNKKAGELTRENNRLLSEAKKLAPSYAQKSRAKNGPKNPPRVPTLRARSNGGKRNA